MEEPLKSVLNEPIAIANAQEIIKVASPLLNELINFATYAFARCQDSARAVPEEDYPLLALYYHSIEMTDGIRILVSQSCAVPSQPLVRSLFEANLSIRYILELEADYEQRALSWTVGWIHSSKNFHELYIPTTEAGRGLRDNLTTEVYAKFFQFPNDMETIGRAKLEEADLLLSSPKYQPIEAEYVRTVRSTGKRYPTWHSLFGGPRSLKALAKHLRKNTEYSILYGKWSEISHATELARFVTKTSANEFGVVPLRFDLNTLIEVVTLTTIYMQDSTNLMLGKFRSSETDNGTSNISNYLAELGKINRQLQQ